MTQQPNTETMADVAKGIIDAWSPKLSNISISWDNEFIRAELGEEVHNPVRRITIVLETATPGDIEGTER